MEIDMTNIDTSDVDVLVHAEGFATIWMFEPVSDAAKEFFENEIEVDEWAHMRNGIAVDHRPAQQLATYLYHNGFKILNPRYGFFVGDN